MFPQGWARMVVDHLGTRVSRPVGAGGVAGQGQARQRDGIPASAPPVLGQAETHHAVRVLVNTVNHSHARTAIHSGHRSYTHGNKIPERLTKNQVLGDRTSSRSEIGDEDAPGLHQSLHQRPRTTVSTLGLEPKDEVRSRTTCR
jgi:hypothetical protein